MEGTKTKKETVATTTSIAELKQYSKGTLIELPCFAEGQPFVARVCRPSLLGLARDGKIPNELLGMVNEMFTSSSEVYDTNNKEMLKEMAEVIDLLVSNMLIEPTYCEIQDAGIELTDDQKIFLYNYSQTGVKSLKSFRTN